jgi:hypothetical protein
LDKLRVFKTVEGNGFVGTGGVERVGTYDIFLKTCVIKENKFNFQKRNLFKWTLFTTIAIKSSNVVNHQMLFKMHSLSNIFPFNNVY